jgi:hypothetical protein
MADKKNKENSDAGSLDNVNINDNMGDRGATAIRPVNFAMQRRNRQRLPGWRFSQKKKLYLRLQRTGKEEEHLCTFNISSYLKASLSMLRSTSRPSQEK